MIAKHAPFPLTVHRAGVQLLVELSGENLPLARAEVEYAQRMLSGGNAPERFGMGPGVVSFTGSRARAAELGLRLGLARRVSRLMAVGDDGEMLRIAGRTRIASTTFAVRPRFLTPGGDASALDLLVRRVGDALRAANPRTRVDLRSPETEIPLLASGEMHWLCESLAVVDRPELHSRDPRRRRMVRPIGMAAKYARAMVNLAGARRRDTVLDPFCGSGGILIEAALLGARPVGIDLDPILLGMAREAIDRLAPGMPATLIEGDSAHAVASLGRERVRRVSAVVTDLPYGRSSMVAGRTKRGVADLLAEVAGSLLGAGKCMVASTDSPAVLCEALAASFDEEDRFEIYVHKSLTRHIFVARKR